MRLWLSVRPISSVAKTTSLASHDAGQLIGLGALARAAFQGADLRPLRAHLLDRLAPKQNRGAGVDLKRGGEHALDAVEGSGDVLAGNGAGAWSGDGRGWRERQESSPVK